MNKITTFLMLFLSISMFGQNNDKIIKLNNDVIECNVKIVEVDYITYSTNENTNAFSKISTNDVSKVVFENGTVKSFHQEASNTTKSNKTKSSSSNDLGNRNILKFSFLSPLLGHSEFSYARKIKPGQSFQVSFGVIGWGIDIIDEDPSGYYTKVGYRFMKNAVGDDKTIMSKLFSGSYVMPELAFRNFDKNVDKGENRVTTQDFAILLNFGRQIAFSDAFMIDYYFGAGYTFSNSDNNYGSHYGFVTFGNSFPIAISAGLRIGYLFGK